jgi:Site-specific recombinase XerD
MRQTFSVSFFLRKKHQVESKPQAIVVRITVNGQSVEMTTHLRCCIQDWKSKVQQAKGRNSTALNLNSSLHDIRARINYIFHQQILHGESTLPKVIKEIYLDESRTKHHLLSFFEVHNENVKKQIGKGKSKATYQKYEVTRKHLKGYIQANLLLDDILLNKIDHKFIWEFEIYLKTIANCGHNTTAKFMQFFKRIIRLALHNHYIKDDPFWNYEIKLHDVHRGYLTTEELKLIINKELKIKRLDFIRDIFVFASFTGLAYSDLKNLQRNHLYMFNGELWLRINRCKTDQPSIMKLFDIPKRLIEKYDNQNSDYIFPVPSNQKVNTYLKEIADLCGIEKNLTFHLARHSAASLALSNGMPIESVSKMLGHKNIRTTQLYAKITDIKLAQDMDELEMKLNF